MRRTFLPGLFVLVVVEGCSVPYTVSSNASAGGSGGLGVGGSFVPVATGGHGGTNGLSGGAGTSGGAGASSSLGGNSGGGTSSTGGNSTGQGGAPTGTGGEGGGSPGQGGSPVGAGGDGGTSSGSGGTSPGGQGSIAAPPPDPVGAPAGDGAGRNIQAIRRVYLGDTDWNGTAADDAWKLYGYNVDGLTFTDANQSASHCKPAMDASAADVVPDGPGGLDNLFGHNLIPLLSNFASDPSNTVSDKISAGGDTNLLVIDSLGFLPSYHGLSAQFFVGRGSDGSGEGVGSEIAPSEAEWTNGTYRWHPYDAGLLDPTVMDPLQYKSKSQFPQAYVADGVFVSGPDHTIVVPYVLFNVTIHHAVVTVALSPDGTSGQKGIVSGVLDTEELVAAVKAWAASLSTSFCSGSTIDNIVNTYRAASDIGKDGKQNPAAVCDGISIGLGFTTQNAALGSPAPDPMMTNLCAGAGGSG